MPLTSSQRTFEAAAVASVINALKTVPSDIHPLIFASPVCARSSDRSLAWHPYAERHKLRLTLQMLAALPLDILKGFVRFFPPFRPLRYNISGVIKDRLLIIPSEVAGQNYIASEPSDAILVYGPVPGTKMTVDIFRPLVHLLRVSLRADNILIALMWLSWTLSLRWLQFRALDLTLSSLVKQHHIRKLGCVHEMHSHSRIIWDVAHRHGATGHTVQHAAFSRAKRWLFPDSREQVPVPDIFYVYEPRIAQMLAYPNTTFRLGRSSRYPCHPRNPRLDPRYYLFATALPKFDNSIVLAAAKKVTPARIRLHPDIARSSTSLSDDLQSAIAVIGMGSTVLLEALAIGIPVIQLTHPDYLDYLDIADIAGVTQIRHSEFSPEALNGLPPVDIEAARNRFGFSHDEVTYNKLFL